MSPPFVLLLPDPLMVLVRHCEVHCVAGCCGLDAFDRDSVHMLPWLRENQDHFSLVLDQISDVSQLVGDQRVTIVSEQDEFNAGWDTPAECQTFLRAWRDTILKTAETVYGEIPSIVPAWRTSDVIALARGIYDERAFDRMPILADALQDAGCTNDDILSHCRDTDTPHARGCWVVDLVLEKA